MKDNFTQKMRSASKIVYILLIVLCLFPYDKLGLRQYVTPAVALFIGLIYAFVFECPYPKFNKKTSKYLLQVSVVGLGFGMNLTEALKSGSEGMVFTIVSV
ncbi:MAG: YeiH family protein, partial [Paramuribaculum sp.]|nr:YeiH family protein [Paramuribaculum sp.]